MEPILKTLRESKVVRRLLGRPWRLLRSLARTPDPFWNREVEGFPSTPPYFGQFGQDELIHKELFQDRTGLTFVDIGAHDGMTFNNTLFFERNLGWDGICIEPMPEVFALLTTNRSAKCILAGVSTTEGTADFLRVRGYAEMLSGMVDTQDPRHIERIEREVQEMGGSLETISVKTLRLDRILEANNTSKIDLLCIDVEGAEKEVLASFDIKDARPAVVCLENNYLDPVLWRLMRRAGYRAYVRIRQDEIYVAPERFPSLDFERRPARVAATDSAQRRGKSVAHSKHSAASRGAH